MKRAIILLLLSGVVFAALTKTTSIVELDAWQQVNATLLDVGNAGGISDSYNTILYLEIAYADLAQDGVDISVEVSYGDDNWTLLTTFLTPSGDAVQDDIAGEHNGGDTTVDIVANGADFGAPGQKWFILDSIDITTSETVRTKSEAADTVTLCHDLLNPHTDDECYSIVHEYIIPVPATFAYVRVLINNTDADSGVWYTTRISKVTAL